MNIFSKEDIISDGGEYLVKLVSHIVDTNRSNKEIFMFIRKCIKMRALSYCKTYMIRYYSKLNKSEKYARLRTTKKEDTTFIRMLNKIELSQILDILEEKLLENTGNWKHQKIDIRGMIRLIKENPGITQTEISKKFKCNKAAVRFYYSKLRQILIFNLEVINASTCLSQLTSTYT